MRKILSLVLCLAFITGCEMKAVDSSCIDYESSVPNEIVTESEKIDDTMRAVWLSYIDLNFSGKSEDEFKTGIDTMFNNAKNLGLNTVICHVRANADAAYLSKYFPLSQNYYDQNGNPYDIDPLEYMVTSAHSKGLKIHAWFNP